MLTRRDEKLEIFEDFRRREDLKPRTVDAQMNGFTGIVMTPAQSVSAFAGARIVVRENDEPRIRIGELSWWTRFWRWVGVLADDSRRTMSVQQFFSSVKNSVKELEIVTERAKGYEQALLQAKATGQTALYETLKGNLEVMRTEAQLVAMGYKKYITEATLVRFVKLCKKGLRLDWVENFGRTMPDDVLKKQKAAIERRIFDNFVVLHYDPKKKSWAETQAQKDRRKDPILFGVIRGSRKLYYIADWVDEYCDLTLDHIADLLGKPAIEKLE
jgi:hypothetical protein